MTRTDRLCARLCDTSREHLYDVQRRFEWTEQLDRDRLAMPCEITTLFGTDVWSTLTDEQQRLLTICETGNLFANTLHGERDLVAGLSIQFHCSKLSAEVTDYLHHFLDEENKHMAMFGLYCRKYVGRIYPEKKLSFPKELAPREGVIAFYSMAMVVEDTGDYFNVRTMRDDRCDPLVRAISQVHHVDESRHLAFDRAYLTDLCETWLPGWDDAQRVKFSAWLGGFMRSNWATYYNPTVYKDAGIPDPYEVRRQAIDHPVQRAMRERINRKLVGFFRKIGLLLEAPPV